MYTIDGCDVLEELEDLPPPDRGAPLAQLVANESTAILCYLVGAAVPVGVVEPRVVSPAVLGRVAVVRFERCHALLFGNPNDEAITAHPLHARGLEPYSGFRVADSSWIRALERSNQVHPNHASKSFEGLQHFIVVLHDSTFECVARRYQVEVRPGSVRTVAADLAGTVDDGAA